MKPPKSQVDLGIAWQTASVRLAEAFGLLVQAESGCRFELVEVGCGRGPTRTVSTAARTSSQYWLISISLMTPVSRAESERLDQRVETRLRSQTGH
jgi:hypothetical protein